MTIVRRIFGNFPSRLNRLYSNFLPRENKNSMIEKHRHLCFKMCKARDLPPFSVRHAHPSDYDYIVSLMKDVFFNQDPACKYLKIPDPPHHALLGHIYEDIKNGMTLVAVEENHCIVGAVINTIKDVNYSIKASQLADCCLPRPEKDLIKFYSHLTTQSKIFEKYCVPVVFDISYIVVDPEWQKMGIARKLVEESWYLARDCAFNVVRVDCTSSHSAKIAENYGWKCVYALPYSKYYSEKEQIFKNVSEPHCEAKVYIDLPKMYEDDVLYYGDDLKRKKKKK